MTIMSSSTHLTKAVTWNLILFMSRSKRKKKANLVRVSMLCIFQYGRDDFWEAAGAGYGCLCCFLQSPMLSSSPIIFALPSSDESPFILATSSGPSLSAFDITSLLAQIFTFSLTILSQNDHCLHKIYLFWFKYYTMYSSVRNITHTLFFVNLKWIKMLLLVFNRIVFQISLRIAVIVWVKM